MKVLKIIGTIWLGLVLGGLGLTMFMLWTFMSLLSSIVGV